MWIHPYQWFKENKNKRPRLAKKQRNTEHAKNGSR